MLTQPRNRAEQLIYQKRSQDQKLSNLQTKLKQDFHQKQFANWQNKGQNLQVVNQMKLQMERMRQQSRMNLQMRRKKLAIMLETQNRQYEAEIIASQETPEQIRQRMAERVKVLKQQKEARRKQQVNTKLERRFEQNADQLRKVDQDLKQLKVAYERNLQMVEKQNILQNQYEEQMLFAQLNRRDQKKKQELEKFKIAQQKEKVDQRNAILAIQKQLRHRKVNEERELDKIQKHMLKEEWERQSELQKLKEKHQFDKLREAQRNIYEENQRQKKIKEQQAKIQRQRDREMIQRIVEKERQLAQYEKWMKQNQRQEAKRVLSSVKNKNKQMEAYEKELDRLIQIQRLKKQKKQEQEWAKRQKARVNLMYDVFHDRQRKVRDHQNERNEQYRQREQDKIQVERRIKEYQEQQQRKRKEEFEKNKRQQQKLLEQIALKEQRRRILLMQLQRQQQQLEKGRKEYGQKIQERKQRGKQQLQTFKKTNRLF